MTLVKHQEQCEGMVAADDSILVSAKSVFMRKFKAGGVTRLSHAFLGLWNSRWVSTPRISLQRMQSSFGESIRWSRASTKGGRIPMNANGWDQCYFSIFEAAPDVFEAAVIRLSRDDPKCGKARPNIELLVVVYKAIIEVVPANPEAHQLRFGKTGPDNYIRFYAMLVLRRKSISGKSDQV